MGINRYMAVAALAFALLAQSLAQSKETFKARLSPLPADARTRAALSGSGSVSAVFDGGKLAITGSFEGMQSPATTANLRAGVAGGVRGPEIAPLTVSKATSGSVSGSVELTPQQIATLHKGGLYVQIQSEKVPDGVLWGWLLQ